MRAARPQRLLLARPPRRVVCKAEEGDQPPTQREQAPLQPPKPPGAERPVIDMKSQPNALGPVGNFFMATLLIFLCGLSLLSTVGRQFQQDLVPLTPEQVIALTSE